MITAATVEHWVPVPGFEGLYDVSDQGRVRSWVTWLRQPTASLPRLISPGINPKTGYPQVVLCLNGRQTTRAVHALVALAFIGPRSDGSEVRHLNGDRTDPRLDNLTYGTASENARDKLRHGTDPNASKTHCVNGHEFTLENTYMRGHGRRECRRCAIDRATAWNRRNRAQVVTP